MSGLPVILVIGGPCSGKSTQCELMATKFGLVHLSSDELLKAEVATGSADGQVIDVLLKSDLAVPFDKILELMRKVVAETSRTSNGFIIDGYRLNIEQVKQIEDKVSEISSVIHFDVADDTMMERLLDHKGRSRHFGVIGKRIKDQLKTERDAISDVAEYYDKQGKLYRIDGNRSKIAIFRDVEICFGKKYTTERKPSENETIERVVGMVLKQFAKEVPEEYAEICENIEMQKAIMEAVKETTTEWMKLSQEVFDEQVEPTKVKEVFSKHLSSERIKLIEDGLRIPTFRLELKCNEEGHSAEFTTEYDEFSIPSVALVSYSSINNTKLWQYASIVVEAVGLLLAVNGIIVDLEQCLNHSINYTIGFLRSQPRFMNAIVNLSELWQEGRNLVQKANALYDFLCLLFDCKIFIHGLIKIFYSKSSWWKQIQTAATVTAMVMTHLFTGGLALIAALVLAISDAIDFGLKLCNVCKLQAIPLTL